MADEETLTIAELFNDMTNVYGHSTYILPFYCFKCCCFFN